MRRPLYTQRISASESEPPHPRRFRAKGEQLKSFQEFSYERQGRYLALTVLYVPHSFDSGDGPPTPPAEQNGNDRLRDGLGGVP